MSDTTAQARPAAAQLARAARVVCGVDGSRADEHAVRQACELAGPSGRVEPVCVVHATGTGATAQATIAAPRAERALERARELARETGVSVAARLVHSTAPGPELLRIAEGADALVVGTHGGGRAAGIALGSAATWVLHRATVPVLVARGASSGRLFGSILVVSDGSPRSDAACAHAAAVAGPASTVTLVTVGDDLGRAARHRLARQAADLIEVTGTKPTVLVRGGSPAHEIADLARDVQCTLITIASGGKRGLRALGSVSERVAHVAPCSVLVARAPKLVRYALDSGLTGGG